MCILKRRINLLLILLCNACSLFAVNFPMDKDMHLVGFEGYQELELHNGEVYFSRLDYTHEPEYPKDFYYDKVSIDSLQADVDGWYKANLFGNKNLLIFGGDYFLFHDTVQPGFSAFISQDYFNDSETTEKPYYFSMPGISLNDVRKEYEGTVIFNNGAVIKEIKKITLPDVLTEVIRGTTVKYDSFSMEHFLRRYCDELLYFNKNAIPWATSKNPIGMKVQMQFYRPKDKITILNGYVNVDKTYLYKANRRLKTIKVTSLDPSASFSLIVNFEDTVHFEEITLPQKSKHVQIEILDFYEGERYTDLCVQMFGVPLGLNWYKSDILRSSYKMFENFDGHKLWNGEAILPKNKLYFEQ